MSLKFAGALIGLALIAGSATAQTSGTNKGASGDDRSFVEALYSTQQPPEGKPTLSREEIAGLKEGTGWGNVFKDLKERGYFPDAKNFGEVVSAFRHERNDLRKQEKVSGTRHDRSEKIEIRAERRASRIDRPVRPEKVERPYRPHRIR